MSRGSFTFQPGETLVWQGTPFWPKLALPGVSILTMGLVAMIYLLPIPLSNDGLQVFVFVFGLTILRLIYVDAKYRGVIYCITDKRVVRSQRLPLVGNTQQILLSSLVRILAKGVRGRGRVVFQSGDNSKLTFGDLEQDPVEVKQIAERAVLAERQSIH